MVATSEVSVSLTLDPSRIWSRDLIDDELDSLVSSFTDIAKVQPDHIDNILNRSRNSKLMPMLFIITSYPAEALGS